MPEPVELDARPETILDGATIAETETGAYYTISVGTNATLNIHAEDGDDVRTPTAGVLHHWLCQGEFYIPEGDAVAIQTAIKRLAGGRDE